MRQKHGYKHIKSYNIYALIHNKIHNFNILEGLPQYTSISYLSSHKDNNILEISYGYKIKIALRCSRKVYLEIDKDIGLFITRVVS